MSDAVIPEAHKNEITALFQTMSDAWTDGDAARFASCFTEEADYVTFAGLLLRGRKAIEETHRELFAGLLKGSSLVGDSLSVHFLSPHVAVAHAIGTVKLRWQKKPPTARKSINTNVIIKENGLWKIAAFHNCRIRKPGLIRRLMMPFMKG